MKYVSNPSPVGLMVTPDDSKGSLRNLWDDCTQRMSLKRTPAVRTLGSWKIQGAVPPAAVVTHLQEPNYWVWPLCISRGEGKYELLRFPTGGLTEETCQA